MTRLDPLSNTLFQQNTPRKRGRYPLPGRVWSSRVHVDHQAFQAWWRSMTGMGMLVSLYKLQCDVYLYAAVDEQDRVYIASVDYSKGSRWWSGSMILMVWTWRRESSSMYLIWRLDNPWVLLSFPLSRHARVCLWQEVVFYQSITVIICISHSVHPYLYCVYPFCSRPTLIMGLCCYLLMFIMW